MTGNSLGRQTGLWSLAGIAVLFVAIAALRIASQTDLHEGDQPKQADYVIDIVCNGNWTAQHVADGTVLSKPPLYNWLAAPLVLLFGAEDVWVKLPSLIGAFVALVMIFDMARRQLGERAALFACVFLLFTSMFEREMYFARTDMLLTCFIVMQFWAIVRWEDSGTERASFKSGWIWIFWIAAALGNLTKGPLAFLPHLALVPAWWIEGRCRERYARLGLAWGLPLAFAPLAIWYVRASQVEGWQVMYDHMIKAEVVDRFRSNAAKMGDKGADQSNRNVVYYLQYVITRALPWSLVGAAGIAGVFTAKSNTELDDRQCGFLRLLAAWFFTTLLFFSLIPSKRPDRIFPLMPAMCLLAGWIFDAFLNGLARPAETSARRWETRAVGWIAVTIAAIFIVAGMLLIGLETSAHLGFLKSLQRKIPASMLDGLAANRVLALTVGTIFIAGGIAAIIAFIKKRGTVLAAALIASNLAFVVVYQLVLAPWTTTDICRGVVPVCKEVRRLAKADGAQTVIAFGSGQTTRFYLLKPGLEIAADKVLLLLEQPHPALYLVGTQPYIEVKKSYIGSLAPGIVNGGKKIAIAGVPTVGEGVPVSTTKWLGAVFVPEKK